MTLTIEASEQLKIDYLLPAIEKKQIGSVVTLPMFLLMPDIAFGCRKQFLQICETASEEELRLTAYWKSREVFELGESYVKKRVTSYIKLLQSVRSKGIRVDSSMPRTYPIVFVHGSVYQRMDGAHRVSIYRFLNYSTVEVWLVTAGEVLAKLDLPADLREALEGEVFPCVYAHEYPQR